MKQSVEKVINELIVQYPQLCVCKEDIEEAFLMLKRCYTEGGKVLVCGNGGSAADSEHIVGELMKGFIIKRKICSEDVEKIKTLFPEDYGYLSDNLQGALPAISLVSQSAISSAFINDVAADMVYAQQVYGYGKKGDVLIGLSTSGNSSNVVNAVKVAKVLELKTIGFTGQNGGILDNLCEATIRAPQMETYKIQELHLPIYHALCAMIEMEFFEENQAKD